MLNKFYLLGLVIVSTSAKAQNISGSYQPMADGQVKKQQVEYVPTAESSPNMVWDFSELELPEASYTVKYTEVAGQEGMIAGTERHTRHYYRQAGDSLLLCGYENNLQHVVYDQPELLLHTPLTYGDRRDGYFHGTSAYGEKLFLRVFGSYTVQVDGMGAMLLPSGDTLRHVFRVHIHKLTAGKHYPDVMTEQELTALVDSIPFTADSIRNNMMDSQRMIETDIYRWYAPGYRYPILETAAVGNRGTAARQFLAYYCAPDDQEAMDDEENEQIRTMLAAIDRSSQNGNNGTDGSGQGTKGQIARDIDVKVNGQTVTVSYELTEQATVTALVCDISGILYRHSSQSGEAGSTCQMVVNCDGLRHGQYVLYLNVNGQVNSMAISL